MFSVCYILTQRMSTLEIFSDSTLYKCSLNNNNDNNNNNNNSKKQLEVSEVMSVCVLVTQSSPALVLDSGVYNVAADANCPNTIQSAMPPLQVNLSSRKAYFILVSGLPLRAKLVSGSFIVVRQLLSLV